jgi:hypothetical protein
VAIDLRNVELKATAVRTHLLALGAFFYQMAFQFFHSEVSSLTSVRTSKTSVVDDFLG